MAQSGRAGRRQPRQLLGVKRTLQFDRSAAANDPKRTPPHRRSTLAARTIGRRGAVTELGDVRVVATP